LFTNSVSSPPRFPTFFFTPPRVKLPVHSIPPEETPSPPSLSLFAIIRFLSRSMPPDSKKGLPYFRLSHIAALSSLFPSAIHSNLFPVMLFFFTPTSLVPQFSNVFFPLSFFRNVVDDWYYVQTVFFLKQSFSSPQVLP